MPPGANVDDMAGNESSQRHSTVLFVHENGGPMYFYMAPCQEKSKLRPLIQHGGGVISSKLNSDSIKLAPEGMTIESDDYIHQKFITDCVKENRLLDMEDYRIASGSVDVSPANDDMEPSNIIIQTAHDKKGRSKYLLADDEAILIYLLGGGHYTNIKGNVVWKDMEMKKVTSHTWQSMKDHYKKVILPNLTQYSLKEHELAKLKGICAQHKNAQGKPTTLS